MKPRTLILRTAGTNCDVETAYAFEQAGAVGERVHLNRLLERPRLIDEYQILALPGGFSYGDDISAGRILANQITHHLRDVFHQFVNTGRPIIGICNGFQILIKTDLLPGPIAGRSGQSCTLAPNEAGRFIDQWVHLGIPAGNKCIWTGQGGENGMTSGEDSAAGWTSETCSPEPTLSSHMKPENRIDLPIAHGEGKFVVADEAVRKALWDNGQVALVYADAQGRPAGGRFAQNPNGSTDDIAGICDSTGLIFGLMPHPERYTSFLQHPAWNRRQSEEKPLKAGDGLRLFQNAVRHVAEAVGAGK